MIRLKFILAFVCLACMTGIFAGCGGVGGSGSSSSITWGINITQTGNFAPGGVGQYSIAPTNTGSAATSGTITVADTLPSVFTASSASGTGWSCTINAQQPQVTCTSQSPVSAGAAANPVSISVTVAQNASGTVINNATVSGGGGNSKSGSIQTQIGVGGSGGLIQHVVIIFQENRTPDNLFQDSVLISRGADIQNYGYAGTTKVPLTPVSGGLVTSYDLGHEHSAFLLTCDWNGTQCAMDGAINDSCAPAPCPANPEYQYVPASAVQPYYTMAETYAFGDQMFQTNQGPSYPAHQYILSGTSAVCVPGAQDCPALVQGGTATSTYYDVDIPTDYQRDDGTYWAGCLAPPDSLVNLMDTSQSFPPTTIVQMQGPECFEHPTLTDLLDNAGLTWKYYTPTEGSIWSSPNVIEHMCQPTGDPQDLTCGGPDWTGSNPKVVVEGTGAQVITDIQNGILSSVTWVIPDGANSDHPGNAEDNGPDWVANIVNAVGESPYWANTAIIVTWDDWGGWYDHVPPPIRNSGSYQNSYEYGFRVPLIVISPYTKAQYVSHQPSDFGSILLFIEEQFSLQQIDPEVGYADSYALSDLSDFFNFSQTPLSFNPIQTDKDAQFFINRKGVPTPPDND